MVRRSKGTGAGNGAKKTFGTFDCPSCKSHWENSQALLDKSQDCRKCKTQVFPEIHDSSEKKNLTPYQGKGKSFGDFKCPKCEKSWSSANTWANMGQQCKECNIKVYPHMQRKLLKGKRRDANKPHPVELCEKCQMLGRSCATLWVPTVKEE